MTDAEWLAAPYPVHPFVPASDYPGGLPGWQTCADDRKSTMDNEVYCDRPENDPIHDLATAAGLAELAQAYATTTPIWSAL